MRRLSWLCFWFGKHKWGLDQVRETYDLAHNFMGLLRIKTCIRCGYDKWDRANP